MANLTLLLKAFEQKLAALYRGTKLTLKWASKGDLDEVGVEHFIMFLLGLVLVVYNHNYNTCPSVGQVIILVVYLGSLVGVAPVPVPKMRSKIGMTYYAGLVSGVLDSFIVLAQLKKLQFRIVNPDLNSEEQERVKYTFLALQTLAALIGGLVLWFGEVYAAGLFMHDGRTGIWSALFIVPPVLCFLTVLGFLTRKLPIEVIHDITSSDDKGCHDLRNVAEFFVGIALLLSTHNPLLCFGLLLMYVVLTDQVEAMVHGWRQETEWSVMMVLFIALLAGNDLVRLFIEPLGLSTGKFAPVIPAMAQAVLWGPLYTDPSVGFWYRLTTLSTGAMIFPASSLVGVMLFQTKQQWKTYLKVSLPMACLWYVLMRLWIFVALETPFGAFLEQWAHTGGHH